MPVFAQLLRVVVEFLSACFEFRGACTIAEVML